MLRWFLLYIIFQSGITAFGQYPKDYFHSPVDFPIYLAGSFAELRSNHFHSGIDIKTGGTEGKPIYAIADGYVSRIKISPYGFGKAIYIAHPNGYTSVYAHLKEFRDPMASYFRDMQYLKEDFALDLYLTPGQMAVEKGDIIALSGNSGSSSGPHLHFEIRTSADQKPVNPALFGLEIKDNIPPSAWWLYTYTNGSSSVNARAYEVTKGVNHFRLSEPGNTIDLPAGKTAFSIKTIDRMPGSSSSLDVHDLELQVDGATIYRFTTRTFSFSETRYLNAHIDYALDERKGTRVHRLFTLPGDHLSMYSNLQNEGWISLKEADVKDVSIKMTDALGNESELKFKIRGMPKQETETISAKGKRMAPNQWNSFETEDFSITLPTKALYDTILFEYHRDDEVKLEKCLSPEFQIHNETTPLHQRATVKISQPEYPLGRKEQTIARREISPGKYDVYEGHWEGNWFVFRTREFGPYHLSMDTASPEVRVSGLVDGSFIKPNQPLNITIKDEESGINEYDVYLDGKWVLMEYDFKRDLLFGSFPSDLKRGEHILEIEVSDDVNNKTIKTLTLKH